MVENGSKNTTVRYMLNDILDNNTFVRLDLVIKKLAKTFLLKMQLNL